MVFLDNLATLDLPSSTSPFTSNAVFEQKSQILPNSLIGRHIKYLYSFLLYLCSRHVEGRMVKVLDAVESASTDPLSYEGGRRTVRPRRTACPNFQTDFVMPSISTLQSSFRSLRNRLSALPESCFANPVLIRRGSETLESTALRELYAAAFHAIHHYAIMGALLREMMGAHQAEKFIPRNFGFKPRTTGLKARL